MNPGPRGFMPREQCKRRSLRPMECRSHLTFSTMVGVFSAHRSDACRAGRRSDISKVRCTSKSSHVRTGSSVCEAQLGRIDFVRCVWIQGVERKKCRIEGVRILVCARVTRVSPLVGGDRPERSEVRGGVLAQNFQTIAPAPPHLRLLAQTLSSPTRGGLTASSDVR